jgi:FkbM family methyltransferase
MKLGSNLKAAMIRSPLERPLLWAKQVSTWVQIRKHPELRKMLNESGQIDRALERLVTRTSNCIDVGCHIGVMLSQLIRLAPQGRHMAFEPVPAKAAWLRRKFPEVEIHQVALSDTPGQITFFENLTRSGFSGFKATPDEADETVEYVVECRPLDDFRKPDRPVSFLKIDVEGAEFLVLRGAVEILKHDRPAMVFESIIGNVEKFGQTRRDFFEFLTGEFRYSIFIAEDFLAGGEPLNWDRFDEAHHYPFKANNFLGIPR